MGPYVDLASRYHPQNVVQHMHMCVCVCVYAHVDGAFICFQY